MYKEKQKNLKRKELMNIYNFVEFENFGLNSITISFIATIFVNIIQRKGLLEQKQTILEKDSCKSIPMLSYAFFFTFLACSIIYGIRIHSLAVTINGLLCIFYAQIYFASLKSKDSEKFNKLHLLLLIMIPITILVPNVDYVFLILAFVACVFTSQAPLEIFRRKDSGSVDTRLIWRLIICLTFWTIYFWCIKNWILFFTNVYAVLAFFVTLFLWHRYSPKARARLFEELAEIEKASESKDSDDETLEFVDEISRVNPDSCIEFGLCPCLRQFYKKRAREIRRRLGLPQTTF